MDRHNLAYKKDINREKIWKETPLKSRRRDCIKWSRREFFKKEFSYSKDLKKKYSE
jgi:hypothetical protein